MVGELDDSVNWEHHHVWRVLLLVFFPPTSSTSQFCSVVIHTLNKSNRFCVFHHLRIYSHTHIIIRWKRERERFLHTNQLHLLSNGMLLQLFQSVKIEFSVLCIRFFSSISHHPFINSSLWLFSLLREDMNIRLWLIRSIVIVVYSRSITEHGHSNNCLYLSARFIHLCVLVFFESHYNSHLYVCYYVL